MLLRDPKRLSLCWQWQISAGTGAAPRGRAAAWAGGCSKAQPGHSAPGWEKSPLALEVAQGGWTLFRGSRTAHIFSHFSGCKGGWFISEPPRHFLEHDFSVCTLQGVGSQSFILHFWLIVYSEVFGNISDIYLIHMFCFQVYIKGSAVKEHIIYTMIHSREKEGRLTLEIFMPFSICIHHQVCFWFLTCKGFF